MTKFRNSLNGIFPGLALLSQPEPSLPPESNRAEQPLSERQHRLMAVLGEALAAAQNGGAGLPIPTGMAAQMAERVIRSLTDEQIEQYAIDLVVKVEWVLSGDN